MTPGIYLGILFWKLQLKTFKAKSTKMSVPKKGSDLFFLVVYYMSSLIDNFKKTPRFPDATVPRFLDFKVTRFQISTVI